MDSTSNPTIFSTSQCQLIDLLQQWKAIPDKIRCDQCGGSMRIATNSTTEVTIEGQWVFGGIERGTGRCFMVPVEKRDATTLIPIIQHWIRPGSIIISDCWRAYSCLTQYGYDHLSVNHKDKETGAHTNAIEALWRHAKAVFSSSNRQPAFFPGYLSKFHRHGPNDRIFASCRQLVSCSTTETQPINDSTPPIDHDTTDIDEIFA